jgi:signal peptidase
VVGRAVNQIPGIGYFVMALASLPGKLVLGWVVLMGAAFSIIGTAIASLARQ